MGSRFFFLFREMKYISVDPKNEIYITMHGLSNPLPAVFQLSLFIVMIKNLTSIQYFWMLKDFYKMKILDSNLKLNSIYGQLNT